MNKNDNTGKDNTETVLIQTFKEGFKEGFKLARFMMLIMFIIILVLVGFMGFDRYKDSQVETEMPIDLTNMIQKDIGTNNNVNMEIKK